MSSSHLVTLDKLFMDNYVIILIHFQSRLMSCSCSFGTGLASIRGEVVFDGDTRLPQVALRGRLSTVYIFSSAFYYILCLSKVLLIV